MVITCPNCSTQFNLADERYMPGRKARCSVCSYIFVLMAQVDDNEVPSVPSAPSTEVPLGGSPAGVASKEQLIRTTDKKKNKPAAPKEKTGGTLKKILMFLFIFIFMAGLGVGGYLFYFKKLIVADLPDPVAARIADIDKVRDLLLLGVKHDYVQNTKLGPLVVITGRVKNNFNVPKDKIRVEASLLDKEGKVLAVQQQYCGIILSDIQLRVLGQKELTHALDNNFEMLANNINIKPGAEVPFMVVFAYPPSSMAEYSVMVADVSDSPDMSAPPAK